MTEKLSAVEMSKQIIDQIAKDVCEGGDPKKAREALLALLPKKCTVAGCQAAPTHEGVIETLKTKHAQDVTYCAPCAGMIVSRLPARLSITLTRIPEGE